MRWIVCLLSIFLGGCQGLSWSALSAAEAPLPIMPLWERYQQCLATTDPAELARIIDQFERVMLTGAEPPPWMRAWGAHVMRQPLRTAVDPWALGASCTLRAAVVMEAMHDRTAAQTFYQRVLARYSNRDLGYYIEQANEALVSLSVTAVLALRADSIPSP
ncbi:MAG: hypothetical protein HOP00_12985 [Nitrospira sp.]|nr:hypothetical protein [Nitrospira sp.]